MTWGGTSNPQEFHQAYEWFSKRVPITKPTYLQMGLHWRRYAFTVAGVAQTQMVHKVWEETLKSMTEGEHLREYKARITKTLENEWAGTVKDPPFRVQTIWRNALQHAYGSGRYQMMTTPSVLAARPYWVFDAILDEDTTEICEVRDSIILHHEDTWWKTNYPPLHHRCRSGVRTATRKRGEEAPPELTDVSEAAAVPTQTGFGYRPDVGEWEPNPTEWPTTLRSAWEKKMKTMGQDLTPPIGAKPEVAQVIKKSKPPKTVHPDPDPLPPPPPKKAELPDIILHEKVGAARGSNPGGFYRGLDGVERYVKFYDDEAQAYGEHIANHVYRALGGHAPESVVFQHKGQWAYASKIIKGGTPLQGNLTAAKAKSVLNDFVSDVLTGNWDAVGLDLDNIVMVGNKAYRVDNGGSFLMRAKAGRKPNTALYRISEWENFADANINPAYARVFKAAGGLSPEDFADDMLRQLDNLETTVTNLGGWENFVKSIAPHMNATDRDAIETMLRLRTHSLLGQYRTRVENAIKAQKAAQLAPGMFSYRDRTTAKRLKNQMYDLSKDGQDAIDAKWRAAGAWADKELEADVKEIVKQWTWNFSKDPEHKELGAIVGEILEHGKVRDPSQYTLFDARKVERMIATRRPRMAAMAKEFGINFPEKMTIRRGVQDKVFLDDVFVAWADDADTMRVRHYNLSSWSYSEETSFTNQAPVTFEVDIDFDDVFSSQIMDDAEFVFGYTEEYEVIPMARANSLVQDTKRVRVTFEGRTYTWDDREAFVRRYREFHEGLGQPVPTKGAS